MLFKPLLALLPLVLATPVPDPEAKPYNPFFPRPLDSDSAPSLNARALEQQQIYTPSSLESRALLENQGRARIELDIAVARKTKYKRVRGEGKRGMTKKIKRQSNGKCAVSSSTPPASTAAPPAASSAVQPTTTSSKASTPTAYTVDRAGNGPFSGWGTYFDVGLSACGTWDTPGMPIVAVSSELFDNWPGYNGLNPNNNPICGKHLDISWGGKTLTVEVTDRCPSCAVRSLDLSKGAFEHFAHTDVGLLGMDSYTGNITWSWTSGSGRLPQVPVS